MEENRKVQERLAQIEKEIEREDITEIELMRLEAEILTIKSKVLHSFDRVKNIY